MRNKCPVACPIQYWMPLVGQSGCLYQRRFDHPEIRMEEMIGPCYKYYQVDSTRLSYSALLNVPRTKSTPS